MTDHDQRLANIHAAILAEPADDTHRLIYADALEERATVDDLLRAEFIRVQCKLAELNRAWPIITLTEITQDGRSWRGRGWSKEYPGCNTCVVGVFGTPGLPGYRVFNPMQIISAPAYYPRSDGYEFVTETRGRPGDPGFGRREILRQREAELLSNGYRWLPAVLRFRRLERFEYQRGFPHTLRMRAEDWIEKARKALQEAPVCAVQLTTQCDEGMVIVGLRPRHEDTTPVRLRGSRVWVEIPAGYPATVRLWIGHIIKSTWPGIMFTTHAD